MRKNGAERECGLPIGTRGRGDMKAAATEWRRQSGQDSRPTGQAFLPKWSAHDKQREAVRASTQAPHTGCRRAAAEHRQGPATETKDASNTTSTSPTLASPRQPTLRINDDDDDDDARSDDD